MDLKNSIHQKENGPTNGPNKAGKELLRPDLQHYGAASNLMFNQRVKKLIKEGKKIYHFGFGQSPFPVSDFMVASLRKHAAQNEYLPMAGIDELRQAIVNFHARYDQLENVLPDQVLVGPGSKELIFLLLAVFRGDVILMNPSWPTYKPQCQLAGHKVTVMNLRYEDQWKVTPEGLEKTILEHGLTGNKLIILCHPDNPTGTCYTEAELVKLSDAFRKHNIIVVSDEIYGRLHYEYNHQSLAKFYPEGTILSTGLSKWASAGGWRVGYHIYPRELHVLQDAVHSAASHTYSCAAAPMQYAVAEMFQNFSKCDEHRDHTTRILAAVADYCYKELSSVGVKVIKPQGGFYMFPDFRIVKESLAARGIVTGEDMCQTLLEEAKVAVLSGAGSFLGSKDTMTTRLCFVNFDGATAVKESHRLGMETDLPDDFVKKFCPLVTEGIEALKTWVLKQLHHNK